MEAIGGYFELELKQSSHYHSDAIKLNTARNCFEYILRAKQYKKVYMPFYTCEVMLEPIRKLNIKYEFYSIDEQLDPVFKKELQADEAFLYTNYFGLKQKSVEILAKKIGNNLIIDNAQAFFAKPIDGIDTFYSARKFFGVADGAYLYTNTVLPDCFEQDISFDRMSHLLKRVDIGAELAYDDFKNNDNALVSQPIKLMSKLTDKILSGIDYEYIKQIRLKNFIYLHSALKSKNLLHIKNISNSVPMVYPYYTEKENIRQKLIENKIYIATYWPNTSEWCSENQIEKKLAKMIIPLPIDQRFEKKTMEFIVSNIKHL